MREIPDKDLKIKPCERCGSNVWKKVKFLPVCRNCGNQRKIGDVHYLTKFYCVDCGREIGHQEAQCSYCRRQD